MPAHMLDESEVVEIVDQMRFMNRRLGKPEDAGIPDYLLEAMPRPKVVKKFLISFEIPENETDTLHPEDMQNILWEYATCDGSVDVAVDVVEYR